MTPPKCVGALLVHNEAASDRYLQRVLRNAFLYCDEVVVLDDHSTDGTAGICRDAGCTVHERAEGGDGGWWGGDSSAERETRTRMSVSSMGLKPAASAIPQARPIEDNRGEAPARAELWKLASTAANGGWVYVFDADHELVGIAPRDFRRLLAASNVDAWACPLYDCWDSDEQHRVDGYWQAWRSPRVWLARAYPADNWAERGIHVGHLPPRVWRVGLMPNGAAIRHLGYIVERHRVDKRRKYLNLQS